MANRRQYQQHLKDVEEGQKAEAEKKTIKKSTKESAKESTKKW